MGGLQVRHVEHIAQREIHRAFLRHRTSASLATAKCTGIGVIDGPT
jgi:hypothetical protein